MPKRRKIARSGSSKSKADNNASAYHSVDVECDGGSGTGTLDPPRNPLLIELVLNRILNMLDMGDLARCSAVNKLWHREARKILRDKRKCFASMEIAVPCQALKRFSEMLAASPNPSDLPYTGLFIPFESQYHWRSSAPCLKTFDDERGNYFPDDIDYGGLLNFKLKYLHIKWIGLATLVECPAALCIPDFIINNYDSLEELQLDNLPEMQLFFLRGRTSVSTLPDGFVKNRMLMSKLKVLRGTDLEVNQICMEEVFQLVRHAPNLEQLLIPVTRLQLQEKFIRPERYHIIKSLCFSCGIVKHAERFEQFAATEPTLRHLIVKYPRIGQHDNEDDYSEVFYDSDDDERYVWVPPIERCWTILQSLFRSSMNTLVKLRLPATVAIYQMVWTWQEFPNLTFLVLEIPFKVQKSEELLHRILLRYNFTARFPKLTSITVDDPEDNFYDPKDKSFRFFRETKEDLPPDTSMNIKTLTYNDLVTDFGIRYLAKLFPRITELNLGPGGYNTPIPYGTIWKEWPELEKLFVFEAYWGIDMGVGPEDNYPNTVNYDADFLGIFEAEAELLQKMDLELVKDLNIVPVKPPLTYMKHLRELTVSFMHNRGYDPRKGDHFFMSPAGCILLRDRMPHLRFKLICSWCHYGVRPLEKYVDVELRAPVWE